MIKKDTHTLLKAKNNISRLLNVRIRSEKEICDRLQQKGYSQDIINDAVNYYKQLDLIDDENFTKQWIHSRLNKPFGLNRIKKELEAKGIDIDILQAAIDQAKETFPELDIVQELAQKRVSLYKNSDPMKAKQRVYGYLVRRGFNYSVINKVVREL